MWGVNILSLLFDLYTWPGFGHTKGVTKGAPSIFWVGWQAQRQGWAGLILPCRDAEVLSSQSPVLAGPQGLPVPILFPSKQLAPAGTHAMLIPIPLIITMQKSST